MKYDKKLLKKAPFILINSLYLVIALEVPFINAMADAGLQQLNILPLLAHLIALPMIIFSYGIMRIINYATPNSKTSKKKIAEEFLSFHALYKAFIIYIFSVAFLASNNQVIGVAFLIPFYIYIINFYTSVSSGKVKNIWI